MVEDDFKHQLSGLDKHLCTCPHVCACTPVHICIYTIIEKKVGKGLNTEPNYHFYKTTYNEVLIKHLICWEDGSVGRHACRQLLHGIF